MDTQKENLKPKGCYFNSLSKIPMLDLSHLVDESFYKTTYRENFTPKDRTAELPKPEKPNDFNLFSKNTTKKYEQQSPKRLETAVKSTYWFDSRDPDSSCLFDSSTESRSSFNGN